MKFCNAKMCRHKVSLASCCALFATFAFAASLLAQGYEIVPVARPVDGFRAVYSPSLNDSGQVAFVSRSDSRTTGLYLYDRGGMTSIAQRGDPADRCEGTLALFGQPWINDSGQIAFSGGLDRPREDGIFFFTGNLIHAIVCPGDSAPGGSTFSQALTPTLNSSGQIAFYARLANRDEAVFFYDGTEIRRVAGTGDPAPGGGTFARALWPSVNDQGQVVFEAEVSAPGRGGIFLWESGDLGQIVRGGDPAPEGGTLSGLYRPAINNQGQVAFFASLLPIPETQAVFIFEGGELRRILPAVDPETGDEMVVSSPRGGYPHPFHFNDLGQIAFDGGRRPPGEERFRPGLFFFDGEGFRDVVLSGDPMPGGGEFWDFHSLSLNSAGQVAFTAFYLVMDMSGVFLAIPQTTHSHLSSLRPEP